VPPGTGVAIGPLAAKNPKPKQGLGVVHMTAIKETQGLVLDIKRSCLHDGPGVRTTVFLKGCPLDCLWCHNPESKDFRPEVGWQPEKCRVCGACLVVCQPGCHYIENGRHVLDRSDCIRCTECADTCLFGALSSFGKEMTVREVMAEILKDRGYFERSGGGLTLSGGEPLAQPDFALALLGAARSEGIHTCVETCGQVPTHVLESAAAITDLFLYDLKETDTERHRDYTGTGNERILENLKMLDKTGAGMILRCPIIPGLNDRPDHFDNISTIAGQLGNLLEIHLMPFHPYAAHKSTQIGRRYELEHIGAPEEWQKNAWREALRARCPVHVR
jgi:pyruvate formate lyase activating enzyme